MELEGTVISFLLLCTLSFFAWFVVCFLGEAARVRLRRTTFTPLPCYFQANGMNSVLRSRYARYAMFGPRLNNHGFGSDAAFGAVKTGRFLPGEPARPSRIGPARCGPRISILRRKLMYPGRLNDLHFVPARGGPRKQPTARKRLTRKRFRMFAWSTKRNVSYFPKIHIYVNNFRLLRRITSGYDHRFFDNSFAHAAGPNSRRMYSAARAEAPPWATSAFNCSRAAICRARAAGSFSHWITCPATAADLSSHVRYSGNKTFSASRLRRVVRTQIGRIQLAGRKQIDQRDVLDLAKSPLHGIGQRADPIVDDRRLGVIEQFHRHRARAGHAAGGQVHQFRRPAGIDLDGRLRIARRSGVAPTRSHFRRADRPTARLPRPSPRPSGRASV